MSAQSHSSIHQCLHQVWQRSQRKHATAGLLSFTRWFLPLFLAVILIDRFAFIPGWLRAVAALSILSVALRQAWKHGFCQLKRFNATRTAQQVEDANGGMDSLLVTAVQFQQSGASPGTSTAMWELTQRKAAEAAAKIETRQVVPMQDLRIPARVALGIAAFVVVLVVLQGPFLAAGLGRLFTPWLAIAYPTKTHIDLGEGALVIQEGAPATIPIKLSGEIPKTAKLSLQTGKGRPRELTLDVKDGMCSYEIASASRDFTYRIKAGDARTDWHPVRVIPAPKLAKVEVRLDYPEYMERETETLGALTITVPEETKVTWNLTLDSPIRRATLHRDGENDLPLEIGEDRKTLTLSETASASRGYSFSWTEDRHDFDFTSPRYFLQVASDQSPRIELTSPAANLNAMLGRPLQLAVRAQDDHGIGTTTITCRVNRRPEKIITLPQPVGNGDGEQTIDWDYRKELTDLQIGDSVSFVVEVADKYPGEGGPHRARTDARRITFLSREDYLAEITKQMERLLTRVRTLYRQQRAAHELMLAIDPTADSFLPTCQLEAIRQEMMREQLTATANEVQALLDDLEANQVSDAVESGSLASLQESLRTIAQEDVARCADLLRAQVGAKTRDPKPAIAAVNKAARELASLVMQRGIDASREVFARETHMLARELASLRLALIKASPEEGKALAQAHEEVATWTDELLDKLDASMRYDKNALAVLGLSRRIHGLRTSGLTTSIRNAATLADSGKLSEAARTQYPLIRPLLESEFTMRSGSEFAQLRDLRERVHTILSDQKTLIADAATESDTTTLAARQGQLRDSLVLATLPTIPAPRPQLFDLEFPPAPASDECRLLAEARMTQAIDHWKTGDSASALSSQQEAVTALEDLTRMLDAWSVELAMKSLGVSASVSDAMDHISFLESLETHQIELLEKTEEAALDEKKPDILVKDQEALAQELALYQKDMRGDDPEPATELLPLLARMDVAMQSMNSATGLLKAGKTEEALEPQEQAATALTDARELAQARLGRLNLIQSLIGFKQSVANASSGMTDVVGGQIDLISATAKADEDSITKLIAPQKNLLQCLSDIAPSLDLVAARLDVGTPLVFAASDVEDALIAMEDGDAEDAADIQQIAVESLHKVEGLVAEIAEQTGYVSEIVEFLSKSQSRAAMLAFEQQMLQENPGDKESLAKQQKLTKTALAYGSSLIEVAGNVDIGQADEKTLELLGGNALTLDFQTASRHMEEALEQLRSGNDATESMDQACKALATNSEQMSVIIEMLNGLPSIELTNASAPELHRLIDVLDVASKQRIILRKSSTAAAKELSSLAKSQEAITAKLGKFAEGELAHPDLAAIHPQMTAATKALLASNKEEAMDAMLATDKALRHFIIEWALILNTSIPPASSSDADVLTESETDDLYQTDAVGFVADFVSGEAPKDQKSEWEILGTRNRAALNQNFARELPLEYRATLKNYYERVAK